MTKSLEKNQDGIGIQENQTQAASQMESMRGASSKADAIEFNEAGSENASIMMGRTSSQAKTNPAKIPDSNLMMNGLKAGRPPKSTVQIRGQQQMTPSSQLFQNRNSSVGISESIEREDFESQVLKNQESQRSGFIENIRINSGKTRPMTAKRRPQHTLINQKPDLMPVQSQDVVGKDGVATPHIN